ncbi:MAG TPA: tripartite tricarboxylate transporter substrate binding protein [Burkholderiaceae bacterium]|nr:tripartite tricarboxylate transporter substrate binding protein [Burkholderiaceae bacterium]
MKITRFMASCALAIGALCQGNVALADTYPERSIRLIVPTSVGSTADVVARVVADGLAKDLGQSFVVENLAGAAGIPGTRQLVSAQPDGYTLAIVSSNHAINPSLYKTVPYDSVKDITPISVIGTTPLVVVVAPESPYKSIDELIKAAQAEPGKLNYGSSGTGSVLHLAGELLKSKAGVDLQHIPYRGGNALITDVMSGQIETAFLAVPSVIGSINGGKLRALAVSTPERVPVLGDVPTLAEVGAEGYAYDAWIALIGPANLPENIVSKLQEATARVMRDKSVVKIFAGQGFVPNGSSTEEAQKVLMDEISRTQQLVEAAGISAE